MDASRSTLTRFGDQLYGEWQRGECAEENHREQNTVSNEFAPPNEKLRQLIRDLDSKAFLALLVVYADFAGDRDEVRRAWDVATNDQSPHWKKLNAFYGQSRGGKGRVRSKKADNEPRRHENSSTALETAP